ncbi:hypothetical protein PR003_g6618 [Phytophthora rubi]|uniref:SET domain-containing protein n=1 Tax=Phytophthora rubi TaxID=129364 RepID=A0A6A4FWB5_9STRA|nr:hypothetical protein PR002_g8852 [Phytophthora rubi]KAE9042041.1 hypothetical protein PR001_g6371 [Phytophthora rubi]KAE9348058.1 hypothetical protein PR003_g6618 [Phytophthora rubi]
MRTGMRGLMVTSPNLAGEVTGQFLGYWTCSDRPTRTDRRTSDRMHLRTRTTGYRYGGIDDHHKGGKLRFMNHACNPCARSHEVQTGQRLTFVAVTVRDVYPGEEVTVSFGDKCDSCVAVGDLVTSIASCRRRMGMLLTLEPPDTLTTEALKTTEALATKAL